MKKFLLFLLLTMQPLIALAQNPADVDFSIEYSALNNQVSVVKIQSDGKILVGGSFVTSENNRLTRFNTDGLRDVTFNTGTGFDNIFSTTTIELIEIQSDGKILVGGSFYTYNGQSLYQLIRLNADGSHDATFSIGGGFSGGNIYSIAIQPDGKILVGGDFTSYNALTQNRLIRLNADGSNDASFNIGTGFNYAIYSVVVQPDGKILVGGDFTTYNSLTQNRLIRLNSNGSKDTGFSMASGFNNTVYSLLIQPDGQILVGGDFTTYNGQSFNRLIRLQSSGSRDIMFGVGTGFDYTVRSIGIQTDGKILVGGDFNNYNGQPQSKLISLNSTGSKNTTFNIGSGFDNTVRSIAIQSDNTILVGGNFTSNNGQTENRLIGLNSDGSKSAFKNAKGFNGPTHFVSIQSDSKILVVGDFTTFDGQTQNRLIRLNSDGTKDSTFNIGTGFNNSINFIEIQSDGKILVGGRFTSFNGQTQNRLIRLNTDGSKDATFDVGTGFPGINIGLTSNAIQSDGKFLIIGNFTNYNGQTQNRLIRLNVDGSKDTTFNIGTGFNNGVPYSIAIQSDEKILICGEFTSFNGQTQNGLIRLNVDGSKDTTFNIGTGFPAGNATTSIKIQSDGKILVGGAISIYNGTNQHNLIRLNTDGSIDTTFNIGTGFDNNVNSIVIQSDGKILVGGIFTTFNGQSQNKLIRLNADGSIDTTYNSEIGFNVSFATIQSDAKTLITGEYNGFDSIGLMRLMGSSILSTTNFSKNNISLYPNPVKDILNVSLSENTSIESYEVYDLIGKNVISKKTTVNSINVSELSNGVYVIKVNTNEGIMTNKFIKE